MNKIKLPLNGNSEVSFKMNIQGTQTKPSQVALNLEKDGKIHSFLASLENDGYVCQINDLDKIIGLSCELKCSITVSLNGKVFTPFRGMADIVDVEISQPTAQPIPQPEIQKVEPEVQKVEQEDEVDTATLNVIDEIPPQPKNVSVPQPIKFEHAKHVNDIASTKTPVKKESILKTIEKPITESKKVKVQPEKPNKKTKPEEAVFEIKRVSVIFK